MARKLKKSGGKKRTWPIKNVKQFENFLLYWAIKRDQAKSPKKKYQAYRNWMMCLIGVNTAFRAEDLLQLRVRDVIKGYVSIKENKTGKFQHFRMAKELHQEIIEYVETFNLTNNQYLFIGQAKTMEPITRQRSHKVVMQAANEVGIGFPFGLHGLRKTFGYHYMLNGGNVLTLMKMYNHDDTTVTLLYIMWGDDDVQADRHSTYFAGKKSAKIARRK